MVWMKCVMACFDGAKTKKYFLHDEDDIDSKSDVAKYFEPARDPRVVEEALEEVPEEEKEEEEKEEEED